MKGRGAVLLILGFAGACSAPPTRIALPSPARPPAPKFVTVKVLERGVPSIRKIPLEDYVQGTIVAEFAPPAGDPLLVTRMYEVQAVLSRTYAVTNVRRHARDGFDLCATTHCQLYDPARLRTSRWASLAVDAAQRTAGVVVWYHTAPARVLFHADCGGHTSAAASVWGGSERPYLSALPDDAPADVAHVAWRHEAAQGAVLRALNADSRTSVGGRLDTIDVLDRDVAGRIERVALHGTREAIVSGEELRQVLARAFGPRTIRSTRFTVRRQGRMFTFEGRGFGHGVGLCQAGALARLRAGTEPAAVLERYFPGTALLVLETTQRNSAARRAGTKQG